MRNPNNPRHKLDEKDVADMKILYEKEGWKLRWIAVKFRVHHTSVLARVKAHGWIRINPVKEERPADVVKIYRTYRVFPPIEKFKTFEEYIDSMYDEVKQAVQKKCEHKHMTVRCANCGKVMGSEVNFKKQYEL
jgi:hypothetical protein